MRLRVHPAAKGDLRDILRYYAGADEDGEIAREFYQLYLHHEGLIFSSPLLFNIRAGRVRA